MSTREVGQVALPLPTRIVCSRVIGVMVYMGCFGLESQEGGIAFSLCRTTEESRSQQSLFLLDAVVLWRHTSPVSRLVEMRVIRETEKHSFGRGLIPGYPNIESMVPAELEMFGGLSFFFLEGGRGYRYHNQLCLDELPMDVRGGEELLRHRNNQVAL